jgi:hypothetical protein
MKVEEEMLAKSSTTWSDFTTCSMDSPSSITFEHEAELSAGL